MSTRCGKQLERFRLSTFLRNHWVSRCVNVDMHFHLSSLDPAWAPRRPPNLDCPHWNDLYVEMGNRLIPSEWVSFIVYCRRREAPVSGESFEGVVHGLILAQCDDFLGIESGYLTCLKLFEKFLWVHNCGSDGFWRGTCYSVGERDSWTSGE